MVILFCVSCNVYDIAKIFPQLVIRLRAVLLIFINAILIVGVEALLFSLKF